MPCNKICDGPYRTAVNLCFLAVRQNENEMLACYRISFQTKLTDWIYVIRLTGQQPWRHFSERPA